MVVLEAESADDWETVVSGCFVPLRCAGFERDFTGRMEHVGLDERISVSLVTTCGTSADRTERLAHSADSDDVHLSLQRSSTGVVTAGGGSASVRPGAITIYATDRPYYLDYSRTDQQQLIVQVSRTSLGLPTAMLEDTMHRLAMPDGVRSPAARNLFSYAAGLPVGDKGGKGGDKVKTAGVLRDLAAVMIRSSFGEGSGIPRTSGGLRHAVQEYLRRNAVRPGLDMDEVARAHFVSRRRLYQVFEEDGGSPAFFLRTERLRVAARLLREEPFRTIEWIAYEAGFRDLTTFTRAFRRQYGCTPREWRATASLRTG
ncbi:AraC family transcriptional regulator [Microbacterium invictum]|uniref:AraC-like DNA-binding protein n=1 Tax=Microbacterium invictum TaxID=515415 RepID=A0AA40VLZ5_9MICO|nr:MULTISPECIES: AraC family transcriptional regulator [Microbacterium]MBB4139876.1 AraC-like DNA-binding protein [Microbacterium invictum]